MTEKSEAQIQSEILLEFGTGHGLVLWRQNTGAAKINGQLVRFGTPGQADLSGVLDGGRALFVEIKSTTGRQSPQQRKFQAAVERRGALYILARSVQDVHDALAEKHPT